MAGKTVFALINPVRGLSEADQRVLVAKFNPGEFFVVGKDGDLCDMLRLFRPGRIWAVAYAGLLADQSGSKYDRVDSMVALKVAAHKRGSVFVEASGKRSDRDWPAMRKSGEDMCRRLAQGAKSAVNGRRGTPPLAEKYSDDNIRDMLLIKADREKYPNWNTRVSGMKKRGIKPIPSRLWFIYQLDNVARERGLLE